MSTILNIITLIFVIYKLTKCQIIDILDEAKYCPNSNTCKPPESHLVCKYPNAKKGPNCTEHHVAHTTTPEIVDMILKFCNDMRTEVAMGTATGKDGILLPRGYGMIRMKWDSELAAFAQVLVNQCFNTWDYSCAATKKFTNPIEGYYQQKQDNKTKDNVLVEHTIAGFKLLYTFKTFVTTEDILKCPSLATHEGKRYLKIVQGGATHVGCAFAEYNSYLYLKMLCYFSYWTELSKPVYNTNPVLIPGTGSNNQCGCPRGYRQSKGCLCEEYQPISTSTMPANYEPKYRNKRIRPILEEHEEWQVPEPLGAMAAPKYNNNGTGRKTKIVLLPISHVSRKFYKMNSAQARKTAKNVSEEKHNGIPISKFPVDIVRVFNDFQKYQNLNTRRVAPDDKFNNELYEKYNPNQASERIQAPAMQISISKFPDDIERDFSDLRNYQKHKTRRVIPDDKSFDEHYKISSLPSVHSTGKNHLSVSKFPNGIERDFSDLINYQKLRVIPDDKFYNEYVTYNPSKTSTQPPVTKISISTFPDDIERDFNDLRNYQKHNSRRVIPHASYNEHYKKYNPRKPFEQTQSPSTKISIYKFPDNIEQDFSDLKKYQKHKKHRVVPDYKFFDEYYDTYNTYKGNI